VPERPAAITVIAAFLFLATMIAAVVGVSLLFPNPLLDRMWELNKPGEALFHAIGRASGLFLLALAGGTFAAALGLLHGRRWAWWFAVVLFSTDATGNVASYFLVHDPWRTITGAIVSLGFLYLLWRREARAYVASRLKPKIFGKKSGNFH
jgi:hypothetical protein